MVPGLEPILLDEVRVAGRLAHDLPRRLLLVFDPERRRRPDQRHWGGAVGEAAELAVLKERPSFASLVVSRSYAAGAGVGDSASGEPLAGGSLPPVSRRNGGYWSVISKV